MSSGALQKFSVHEENDIRKIPPAWSSHEQAEIQYIVRGSFELCIGISGILWNRETLW